MANTQLASDAARDLARARWGDSVVRRAVATVAERRDELDDDLRAELLAVVSPDLDQGDADE